MEDDQNVWNFFFTMLFVGLVVLCIGILVRLEQLPLQIEFFDAVLITLATFRLIRLVVYDKIMRWFRDLFFQKISIEGEFAGATLRQKHVSGPLRTLSDLVTCPWCFGVWAAFMVSFFYFLTPYAWYPIFFLAVAGVASLAQLLANLIGWYAEEKKLDVEER